MISSHQLDDCVNQQSCRSLHPHGTVAIFLVMSESTIYRSSTIAQCLSSSVDELVADDRIDADTADAIMEQFDKV